MSRSMFGVALAWSAAALVACSGGSSGSGSSSGGAGSSSSTGGATCLPGATLSCACPGGAVGVQTCNPDGRSVGACACGSSTTTSSGSSTTSGSSGATSSSSSSGSGSSTTGTSSGSSTATGSSSGSAGSSGSSGSTGATGPQLVRSLPADGDTQASIANHVELYFDRQVDPSAATGKLSATSDQVATATYLTANQCPSGDATCVAAYFPNAFLDGSGHLPSGTHVNVVVSKSFPDLDGGTNSADQSVAFTTFTYDPLVADDSAAVPVEVGGLDYDPASQALFAVGVDSSYSYPIVRRIPVVSGVPQEASASTFAQPDTSNTGGPYCYGLDVFGSQLYVSGSYASRVFIYGGLSATTAMTTPRVLEAVGLAAPDDTLLQVTSVAAVDPGPDLYLGFGRFLATAQHTGVLENASDGGWSVAVPSSTFDPSTEEFSVAPAYEGGQAYLYVASSQSTGAVIQKVRLSDHGVVNSQSFAQSLGSVQMRVDSRGYLYVAAWGAGLSVYDTSGSTGFRLVTARDGLSVGRFGLKEQGNTVRVFYTPWRGSLQIGATDITY